MFSNKKEGKNQTEYVCEICDFASSNKKDHRRHLETNKHINRANKVFLNQGQGILNQKEGLNDNKCHDSEKKTHCECACGKIYKDYSGLWRHRKICKVIEEAEGKSKSEAIEQKSMEQITTNGINLITAELVLELIKENKELKQMILDQQNTVNNDMKQIILEQNNTINNLVKNGISNTNNSHNTNSNNKAFNLQFFLNETCKDAMNIMDFVDSIKLQLSDLEKFGEVGYTEGISSIITSNLKALDVTQRPVHCTDKKRETMYVKDENKWEKEDDNRSKLRQVIKRVANKNIRLLPLFREKYPEYKNSSSRVSDIYDKMVVEAMGGFGNNDLEKEDKIIHNISKCTTIEKIVEGK